MAAGDFPSKTTFFTILVIVEIIDLAYPAIFYDYSEKAGWFVAHIVLLALKFLLSYSHRCVKTGGEAHVIIHLVRTVLRLAHISVTMNGSGHVYWILGARSPIHYVGGYSLAAFMSSLFIKFLTTKAYLFEETMEIPTFLNGYLHLQHYLHSFVVVVTFGLALLKDHFHQFWGLATVTAIAADLFRLSQGKTWQKKTFYVMKSVSTLVNVVFLGIFAAVPTDKWCDNIDDGDLDSDDYDTFPCEETVHVFQILAWVCFGLYIGLGAIALICDYCTKKKSQNTKQSTSFSHPHGYEMARRTTTETQENEVGPQYRNSIRSRHGLGSRV